MLHNWELIDRNLLSIFLTFENEEENIKPLLLI